MAFVLQRADPLLDALRDVALEQLDIALDAAYDPARPAAQRIHRIRVCCKRLRALLRLVESGLSSGIKTERRLASRAARRLAAARDARVLLDTHRAIAEDLARADANGVALLGDRLEKNAADLESGDVFMSAVANAAEDLEALWEAAARWHLKGKPSRVVARGYALTYRRAQAAAAKAQRRRDRSSYHRWRTQVKYHYFHTRLLDSAWPLAMAARANTADDLAVCLGRSNDLAAYSAFLKRLNLAPDLNQALQARADEERQALWTRADTLGQRLFHQSPRAIEKDMRELWKLAKIKTAGD